MYDRILFPTDGSDPATAALDYVRDVASTHDATVHVLNVVDTTQQSLTQSHRERLEGLSREGERIVSDAASRLPGDEESVVTDVLQGVPHERIVGYCEVHDIDLVVMPTHGRSGLGRFLLGSVTERVIATSPVPVLAVTPTDEPAEYPPRDVLVPTDGSQSATRTLEEAVGVANATGALVHLLCVAETARLGLGSSRESSAELRETAEEILTAAADTAREGGLETVTRSVSVGRPYREIRTYVDDHDVDLVAVGTHGETDFSQYVLGGVSSKLLRTSPVPVLLTRESGKTPGNG